VESRSNKTDTHIRSSRTNNKVLIRLAEPELVPTYRGAWNVLAIDTPAARRFKFTVKQIERDVAV